MSVLQTVGVLGAVGGIGLIGYYYLSKNKPTTAKRQKEELLSRVYIPAEDTLEYRKIWAILANYYYSNIDPSNISRLPAFVDKIMTKKPLEFNFNENQILEKSLSDLFLKDGESKKETVFYSLIGQDLRSFLRTGKGSIDKVRPVVKNTQDNPVDDAFKKSLVDDVLTGAYYTPYKKSVYNYAKPFNGDYGDNKIWKNSYFENPPDPSGKAIIPRAKNCSELDRDIKKIRDEIVQKKILLPQAQSNTAINQPTNAGYEFLKKNIQVLTWYKDILEDYSEFQACRDKIEQQRAIDLAKQVTVSSITAEANVLGKNQKSQDIYLGIGAVVLVLSTAILLSASGKSSTPSPNSSKSSGVFSSLVIVGGLSGMGYLILKKPKAYTVSDENVDGR